MHNSIGVDNTHGLGETNIRRHIRGCAKAACMVDDARLSAYINPTTNASMIRDAVCPYFPWEALTGACVARSAVIESVVAPTAGLLSVTLQNDSAVGGNSKVPRQQVERSKRGCRSSGYANGYTSAGWYFVACDGRDAPVNFAPVEAFFTDKSHAAATKRSLARRDTSGDAITMKQRLRRT